MIDRQTLVRVYGRTTFDLTTALAKSNNQYFANLGQKLGFERVSYYAQLFGLGEKAGLDIEERTGRILPSTVPKSGIGMMTSFGDGISLTPLELRRPDGRGGQRRDAVLPAISEDASTKRRR